MKRIDPFIWDEAIRTRKRKKHMKKLMRGKAPRGLHLVILPADRKHLLSIVSSRELLRQDRLQEVAALGAAGSHEKAKELVRSLVDRVYARHGSVTRVLIEEELLHEEKPD